MPTVFTHALVTAAIGKSARWSQRPRTTALCVLCGVIPDLDGLGFHFGVPYLHTWGHRGASHSLAFALVTGLIFGLLLSEGVRLRGRLMWGLLFGLLIATHPLLDMLTTGGHGVALWAPFDHARHFFPEPWRVIRVSPMSLTPRIKVALLSELYWVWTPTLCALTLLIMFRHLRRRVLRKGNT